MHRTATRKLRRDGWTADRQLIFLDALAQTRSAARAAASAGMSRESAYRLRGRNMLFAAIWDRLLASGTRPGEVHTGVSTDGRLARLLGNLFRRQSGDFFALATEDDATD